jgi:hypothetical protein
MMTDTEVREQVERADRFREALRDVINATVVDPTSACADASRRGLRRIAETLDAVEYVTFCNLSNVNTAMRGALLEVIEVHLLAVGGGPTLDFEDATAFLAEYQPMIDMVMARRASA